MVKTKYQSIPNEYFGNYLNFLVGRVWKILPMSEEGNINLKSYMESLQRELIGNMNLIENLKYDGYFITLLNKIEYLINEDCEHYICRKEVFGCIGIIKKLSERHGFLKDGDVNEGS